ncbi:MAG TPA: hypothetical protein VE891_12215, partial [Allosphingosinicella sp.]|nr:hypothetical protein [Allosphingosinicella sp.]
MSRFLAHLADRAQGLSPLLEPRPFAAFEPDGDALLDMVAADPAPAASTAYRTPGAAASPTPWLDPTPIAIPDVPPVPLSPAPVAEAAIVAQRPAGSRSAVPAAAAVFPPVAVT